MTQPATVAAGSSPQATAAVGQKVLPKNERSDVLHELVLEGWLAESPDRSHHYSLGVRAVLAAHQDLLHLCTGLYVLCGKCAA